jgi:phosphoribosylformylglycinamidine synthase
VDPSKADKLNQLAKSKDIKIAKLGTTGGDSLVINDAVISLEELRRAHTETFPRLFG